MAQVTNPYVIDNINKNYNSYAETNIAIVDLSYYARDNVANFRTITKLPQENIDYLNSVCSNNMGYMFYNCNSLTTLDVSQWDTSQVTNMENMFQDCQSLTTITGTIDMSSCMGCYDMFDNCSSLQGARLINIPETLDTSNMGGTGISLDDLVAAGTVIIVEPLVDLSHYSWNHLANWNTITELPQENVDYLNSVYGTNMRGMLSNCEALTTLDVTRWDTSQVTNMENMFYGCVSLTSLNTSNWDTSKVTNMSGMFYMCWELADIGDISNWNTNKVTNMSYMFNQCKSLTTLNLSNWNTDKVTNMNYMFNSCNALTTITGIIDMSSCTRCNGMFNNCNNLQGVHLKNVPSSLTSSLNTYISNGVVIVDNYI